MMLRLSTTVRLSISLTLLTLSVLLTSELFGLLPNHNEATMRARAVITESLAVQLSALASRDDVPLISYLLEQFVERSDEVASAAFRDRFGRPLAIFGNHIGEWAVDDSGESSLTQVAVPVYRKSQLWGTVEVRFRPLSPGGLAEFFVSSSADLFVFVCVVGFILYYLFLRRALNELNPSKVIPDRVREAFDVLAEGLFILDTKCRIVLANTSIASRLGIVPEELVGKSASDFDWSVAADAPMPWVTVLENGEKVTNLPVELVTSKDKTFAFTLLPSR